MPCMLSFLAYKFLVFSRFWSSVFKIFRVFLMVFLKCISVTSCSQCVFVVAVGYSYT